MRIGIVFVGFGNVGKALLELLLDKQAILADAYDIEWQVRGIVTGHHGIAISPKGIDPHEALSIAAGGGDLSRLGTVAAPGRILDLLRASQSEVMFENTPVNYQSGQPGIDHLKSALACGMDAITANKGPVVHAYRQLRALAASAGRSFLFESTVMDGAPLFGMWREALPAADLAAFRGVLNSTSNYILGLVEKGDTMEGAIARAQEIGVAETDPSGDLEGWDAAVKTCALVTVLMGVPIELNDISRSGIEGLDPQEIRSARQAGKRWKLVCSAERHGDGVQASVRPELLGRADPLYGIEGTSSAVTFHSNVLGALTLTENNPGPHTTAYGLLADFIHACSQRRRSA